MMWIFICVFAILQLLDSGVGLVHTKIPRRFRIKARGGKEDPALELKGENEGSRSKSFDFDERTDAERGMFKLGSKSNIQSPFEPPPELSSSGPRTGGDGDKVVLFTCATLALLVQFFLASNKDAPSFDSYIPIAERVEVKESR